MAKKQPHHSKPKGEPKVVEIDGRAHLRFDFEITDPETGTTHAMSHHRLLDSFRIAPEKLAKEVARRGHEFAVRADNLRVDPASLAAAVAAELAALQAGG